MNGLFWDLFGSLFPRQSTSSLSPLAPKSGATSGYPRSELASIAEDVVSFCDLVDRPARTYSNGMRLRLCFGVITVWPADILLVDEVIGVGDNDFKQRAIERMKDFIFRSGILILASHDQGILSSFCKESILLDKGEIVERTVLKDPDPG